MKKLVTEQKAAMEHYKENTLAEKTVFEIKEFKRLLREFGLNFKVLSKDCPKHVDARENAKEIARLLVEDEEMTEFILEKKQLPVKDLVGRVTLSRKMIKRNRKYIIAIWLIYVGRFQILKSYIC
ncbi:hypothetical protein [Fictibacillus terranigra]|uniref:Uncharacterized protein n=1 Tax=Fictibacillus terranigra TaxID=3058424 RepID=A0ABT8EBK1_9BACL|nr:hypothetical protein [Fictibacillus sp. CENA-BCM004]MDN4075294.1 hypothetical protein [Fictibacillus sp. CENA-BCM004]